MPTLQRKSHVCIAFLGIVRPQIRFHVSVSDLYILRIGPQISCSRIRYLDVDSLEQSAKAIEKGGGLNPRCHGPCRPHNGGWDRQLGGSERRPPSSTVRGAFSPEIQIITGPFSLLYRVRYCEDRHYCSNIV